MSQRNFYEILNVTPEATVDELRRNYKQLILQCHPDKLHYTDNANHPESSTRTAATNATIDNTSTVNKFEVDAAALVAAAVDPKSDEFESSFINQEFVAINEAWNTLKDPAKRRLYDAELLLTKFEAHINIFARLTLDDMKRCAGTTTNSGSDSDNDHDDGNDHENIIHRGTVQNNVDKEGGPTETANSTKVYWYYTYDCRCGGQYILDESADSEILNRKRKRRTRSDSRNHDRKQKHSLDNDNDNNCTRSVGGACTQAEEANGDIVNNAKNNSENSNTVQDEIGARGIDFEDNDDGDVIVECSECSLVIVLT